MRFDVQVMYGYTRYIFASIVCLAGAVILSRFTFHTVLFASILYSLKLLLSSIPICVMAFLYREIANHKGSKLYTGIFFVLVTTASIAILLLLSIDLSLNVYIRTQFDQIGAGAYLDRLDSSM